MFAQFPLVDALPIEGKRVLMRVDFNLPLEDGRVADDSRVRAAMPSIRHVLNRGARLVLCSHLGRPEGEAKPEFSLAPAGEVLAGLLEQDVLLSDVPVGDAATKLVRDLRDGQVVLLENLRFDPGETANDDSFARGLAAYGDCYVNDAFGTAHRAHASTVGVAKHLPLNAAGFLIGREVAALGKLLAAPRAGFVAILGGAKVSGKIAVLEKLLTKVDTLLVGGAMAYTFLAAQGRNIGKSMVEEKYLGLARDVLRSAERRGVKLMLPVDHACADRFAADAERTHTTGPDVPEGSMGLDIGPQTALAYAEQLASARTIFWNGPMGVFEFDAFAEGTHTVADAVADSDAFTVIGGGDSVRAINESGRARDISHISTGGGASLEFVQGRTLPGLAALGQKR